MRSMTSHMLDGRAQGSIARQASTSSTNALGTSVRRCASEGAGTWALCTSTAAGTGPTNGTHPDSISNINTPHAYTSNAVVAGHPCPCSGAMVSGVPMMTPGRVHPGASRSAAMPKSSNTARSPPAERSSMTFWLFRSTLADATARTHGRKAERALTVRRLSVVRKKGRAFWRTKHGWIDSADVVRFRGSDFEGTVLGDLGEGRFSLPVAWTLAGRDRRTVAVRESASTRAREVRRLVPHTLLQVVETSTDERWLQIEDGGWVAREDLRVARATEPPEIVGEGERWIDVDLDQQTVVAYEGTTPVYATLVSTGRVRHRTPTGVFRISRKVAERTMNSMADSDEQYTVEKVPWTFYFDTGYALHAAFWHNGFGRPRSHGCVNLSPHDARRLYGWTSPAVAPGWSEVYGHAQQPGSVVRIRDRRDPEPSVQGYAQALHEDRTRGS
jgi:hypothetical protein